MGIRTREEIRKILLELPAGNLAEIWASALGNKKAIMVEEIMQYSDEDISKGLQDAMHWDFQIKG